MTYVIAAGCCSDASCIPVCPVDCIRPRPGDPDFMTAEQLYIDPASCTDCAACLYECPVEAIHDEYELPEHLGDFKDINAEYFDANPLEVVATNRRVKPKLTEDAPTLRVAVIGAGPAGCYAADDLSRVKGVEVSLFDRLPTPYGLVRAGVAPDHATTKNVAAGFHQVLRRSNVTCYFNVELGRDISIGELLDHHHAVIYAGGADDDRRLGLNGEDLPGSHSAREFVAWYNGHPDHAAADFDLTSERAIVIGNGNVALDVARVLASPEGTFDATDMAPYAVDALRASRIREVVVVARRGVADASYTTSEFMALVDADGIEVTTRSDEVVLDVESSTARRYGVARRRNLAGSVAVDDLEASTGDRRITFRYMLTPVAIEGDRSVEAVRFRRTDGDDDEVIEAGLVLRAAGYRASPVTGMPFDAASGTVSNIGGRVVGADGVALAGLYATGWAKRGATGVIGSNKVCSAETVERLFEDQADGRLAEAARTPADLAALLAERRPDLVSFQDWLRIDAAEVARGAAADVARPRQKFFAVEDMLAAVRASA